MSVYLLLGVDIDDPVLYGKYAEGAGKALRPYKLKKLTDDSPPKVYEGQLPAKKVAIMEFESEEKFDEFYNSSTYQEVVGLRHEASDTKFIVIMKSADD